MKQFVLLFCVVWLLCACGQSAVTQSPPTSAPSTPVPSLPPITPTLPPTLTPLPALTPPVAKTESDPIVKQAVLDQGYGLVEAEYIARTNVVAQQIDATTWHVLMATPTGHLIDQTIQYSRGATADIGKPVVIAPLSADAPDTFSYSYTVSAADAPPEILDAIRAAPVAHHPSRMMRINPPMRVAVDVDAVLVNIKGFVKQYAKDQISDFTKLFQQMHPNQPKLYDMWNALKAGMYVYDAFWMFEKVWPYLNALDYLQACAEKPWNPLTKKSYRDFPEDKQRILDRIESARSEIRYEGMYMYTVVMNKVLFMGVPGLSTVTKFILGKGLDDFIAETEQRMKKLIAEMEKMVTPCNGWRFVQKAPAGYPFSFEGTKCGGIDGTWTIEDDSNIGGGRTVSKIEISVSEEEWLKGKQDFLYISTQTTTVAGTRGEYTLTGFTKQLIVGMQTMQFYFNNPISCRAVESHPEKGVDPCKTILKYVNFTAPSDSIWVEDASICQAEKADMMRYSNWKP